MALKIRLARGGSKKHPFYRIVVAEASSPRDGRFVERLGSYDPMVPKDHENRVSLKDERIKFWMSKGAKPTLRVHKILAAAGLLDAPIIREQPIKAAPGKKRLERENEAKEAAEAPAEAPAETPAEAAKDADYVFTCVGNDNDLREVTFGEKGIFKTIKKDAVYIDNTTASATIAREIYDYAKKKMDLDL